MLIMTGKSYHSFEIATELMDTGVGMAYMSYRRVITMDKAIGSRLVEICKIVEVKANRLDYRMC